MDTETKGGYMRGWGPIIVAASTGLLGFAIVINAFFNQGKSETIEIKDKNKIADGRLVATEKYKHLLQNIQSELKALNIYNGKADGKLTEDTKNAIIQYQARYKYQVNGRADEDLLSKIRLSRRIYDLTKESPTNNTQELTDKNKIEMIQIGLAELGYRPGIADGVIGTKTREAIKAFQINHNMEANGEVSEKLLRELQKVTGISSLKSNM